MDYPKERLGFWRRRLAALEAERNQSWTPHWRELSQHFMPRRARFLDVGEKTNQGDERNRMFDGVGIMARRTLSAGMQSGLTSPARPWFMLTLQDDELARAPQVKEWLHVTYERMVAVFGRSNFYDQIHLAYDELGTFGTACMMVESDSQATLRCRTLTVGEYCLDTDQGGRVDVVYRRIRMTPRQILEAWPETAPERIASRVKSGGDGEWETVIHVIEPNDEYAPGMETATTRPYTSAYFLDKGEDILEIGGFYEFPALCPRWNTTGSDVYGESPAMDALNDCRLLQKLARDGLAALEKEVNPPLMMSMSARKTPLDTTPGKVNLVSPLTQGQQAIMPLYQVKANLQQLAVEKATLQQAIKEFFYNDLFLMVSQVNRQMTATEVAERNSEKMLLLGPVLDRLRSELFQPLITRTFGIMQRQGLIPQPPKELEGQEVKVEFISILAMAQKQQGVNAINNVATFIGGLAQIAPEGVDKLNIDEAIDEVAEMNGIPPKMIRSADEVAEIREARQQKASQQEQLANAQMGTASLGQGARAVKDLAEAQTANALDQMGTPNGGR